MINLRFLLFILIFAKGIVGSHDPMTRELSTSPFPINNKVDAINKLTIMPRKRTLDEFVSKARIVHGDKYDYNKVVYINDHTKVCIICPIHGDFLQMPQHHLKGSGCPQCGLKTISDKTRMTTEVFIEKAHKIHGNRYSYEKTRYKGSGIAITITCAKHGDFQQIANTHLQGCGCPKCKADKTHLLKNKGIERFIIEAKEIHSGKYDYSQSVYVDNKTPIAIICQKHGLFMQTPNSHLRGCGCPKCADEKTGDRCRLTYKEFIRRAKEVHGDKYDYSLVNEDNFVNSSIGVYIICPIHGKFRQTPNDHLNGRGCYKCGKLSMAKKQALTRDEVVARLNDIFDNKYDYSLFTEYHNRKDRIKVICPKHGVWEVGISNHLYRESGCPKCKRSLGEERVAKFLREHGIEFKEQFCIRNDYLFCNNTTMFVDFYLPKFNAFIEYNGEQHYHISRMFTTKNFEQQKERDNAIRDYCFVRNIKLIEIPYTDYDNIESILSKELKTIS